MYQASILFFLLLCFFSFFSFAGKKDVNVEISEVLENLRAVDRDQPPPTELSAYLDWLRNRKSKATAQLGDGSDMECDDRPELPVFINDQLRPRILEINTAVQNRLEITDILDLLQEIDDRVDRKQFGIFYKKVRLNTGWTSGTNNPPVKVEIKEPDEVFIDFGMSKLGEGKFKTVKRIVAYKTWSRLSRLKFRAWIEDKSNQQNSTLNLQTGPQRSVWVDPRKSDYGSLKYELSVLRLISGVPKENREGLAALYHIVNDNEMIQKIYDFDLLEFLNKTDKAAYERDLTYEQKLEIYRQLTVGLINLHRLHISHNDVKLENAFLTKKTVGGVPVFKAAYGDFGLAKLYNDPSQETVSGGGSLSYGSPDRVEKLGWIGTTPEQKIQNALKTDIFSHAVLGLILFTEKESPFKGGAKSPRVGDYLNQMRENPENYSSILHLLLKGLEIHPENRPSAEQFLEAVKYLQKKEKIFPHPNGRLRIETLPFERQSKLGSISKVIEKIEHIPGFIHPGDRSQAEKIKKELEGSPRGTYVVFPRSNRTSSGELFGVGVYFNGISGLRGIQLDTAIDTTQIENEIGFLKNLGDLTEPLQSVHGSKSST